MRSWCAYQERSQYEALKKLQSLGVAEVEAGEMLSTLIGENFISEERFATAFAGGKFRMKQWGRRKIASELRRHQVSAYSMNRALAAFSETEYEKTLAQVLEKKLKTLKGHDPRKKYYSAMNYALSRGFEGDMIAGKLKELLGETYEFRT